MNEQKKPEKKINIELGEDVAAGTYSNLAIITHSNTEFVVDFVRLMPGVPKAKVKSRVILTPQHAKRLMKALKDFKIKGMLVSESPNIEGDSILTKKTYNEI